MYTFEVYSCTVITRVEINKRVLKQLRKLPQHIADALLEWVLAVEELGLQEVRKIPGYHDEPLRGNRAGQRAIRFSRS